MAFCPKCGAEVPESGVCAACNASASPSQQPNVPPQAPPPPPYMPPPPQAPPPPYGAQGDYGAPPPPVNIPYAVIRSPGICILLSIVTCGIYYLYWLWATHKQINELVGTEVVSSGMLILSWFCAPVLWYHWYKWDNDALPYIASRYNFDYSSNFILWLILTLVFGVGVYVSIFQIQEALNKAYVGR